MKRYRWISALRGMASLAVVLLHTSYIAVRLFQPDMNDTLMGMCLRNLMLWSVPCFVMITGALLLNPEKEMTIGDIFHKYIRRAFLALVIFTFVFALFDYIVDHQTGNLLTIYVTKLLTNHSWLHMWYLYMLTGMYLVLPIGRTFVKHAGDEELKYTVLLLFIFQSCISTLGYFTGDQVIGFYIPVYTVYPFYFLLGWMIHAGKIVIPKKYAWALFLGGTALILVTTCAGILQNNAGLISLTGTYAFVATAAQSTGVFVLCKDTEKNEDREPNALTKLFMHIDTCSFGIYLIHVLYLYIVYRVMAFNPFMHGGIFSLLGLWVCTSAVSWLTVYLLKKIPGVNQVL